MTPILLIAFGALSAAARETYGLFEADVRAAYPERDVRWAYTAASLVARLRERGQAAQTLAEAFDALRAEGHDTVAICSLHLVPGEKHREIEAVVPGSLNVAVGRPLLGSEATIEATAQQLLEDFPRDRPVLVVAHGHAHEPRYNAELLSLKAALVARRPDVHLTLLEGEPDESVLEAFMAEARRLGKVHVCPFLFVAGDHVQNDILGEDPDSLRSRFGVADFTCGEALGHRSWIRRAFLDRLAAALVAVEIA